MSTVAVMWVHVCEIVWRRIEYCQDSPSTARIHWSCHGEGPLDMHFFTVLNNAYKCLEKSRDICINLSTLQNDANQVMRHAQRQ